MNIKITADSTCDLSEELLRQWNISLMPMHILMGDDTYLDGVTIHPADVFAHVDAGGQTPKSAAANPVEYIDFFEPFATEYDAVIHISVSAKLSSCYQNACLAAQEYANVSVIDSENICTGQGYLVLRAAKWAAGGLTARNICMRLQSLANRVELSFVLNQLNYMAKSGRCSGVLAFGANILGIKPSLAIIDGELKVVRKYRGSLPICVGKYITDLLDGRDDIDNSMVFISSCQPKSLIRRANSALGCTQSSVCKKPCIQPMIALSPPYCKPRRSRMAAQPSRAAAPQSYACRSSSCRRSLASCSAV